MAQVTSHKLSTDKLVLNYILKYNCFVSVYQYNSTKNIFMANKKFVKDLVHNLTEIQSDKNMLKFLDLLLTTSELEDLSNRLQIFKGLLAGQTQREIANDLKVSISTVIRGAGEWRQKKDRVKKMVQR